MDRQSSDISVETIDTVEAVPQLGVVIFEGDRLPHALRRYPGRGIKIFGLQLLFASDDFVFPALIEAITRLFFLLVLLTVYCLYVIPEGFAASGKDFFVEIYLTLSIILFICQLVVSALLCWNSAKGTIWDPNEKASRKLVSPLVHASIVLAIVEVAVNSFGVYSTWKLLLDDLSVASNKTHLGILLITVSLWAIVILKFLIFLCSISYLNDLLWRSHGFPDRETSADSNSASVVWTEREEHKLPDGLCIRLLSKGCFHEDNVHHFHQAAEIFKEIFRRDMLLLSDIMAALMLLFSESEGDPWHGVSNISLNPTSSFRRRRSTSVVLEAPEQRPHSTLNTFKDLVNPKSMLRFMEYAYAMYGSTLYLISSKSTLKSCGDIMKNMTCCGCCCCIPGAQRSSFVVGDGCCKLGLATVKATLKDLDEEDIVYMSFRNVALVTPFMVAVDHKFSSIVISIRGSGSIPDLLTDLSATPTVMADVFKTGNLDRKFLAHGGMIQAAYYIYKKLVDENILHMAFIRCNDYKIIVTGHSLGAGIASILGFFLRSTYSNTYVFAYGPPGGLLSPAAWRESKKFTCSVVAGDDVVARLSLRSIYNFRELMKNTLVECKEPKYKIIYQGLLSGAKTCLTCECCREEFEGSTGAETTNTLTDYGSLRQSESTSHDTSSTDEDTSSNDTPGVWPIMLPPGQLFHVCLVRRGRRPLLDLIDVKDPSYFSDIIVSPRMLNDHFPQTYVNALKS